MTLKNTILFVLIGTLLSGILIWSADVDSRARAIKSLESTLRLHSLTLRGGMQEKVQDWNSDFERVLQEKPKFLRPYQPYQVVGSAVLKDGDWTIENFIVQSGSKMKDWAPSYIQLAVQSIKWQESSENNIFWAALFDPHRTPYVLMITSKAQRKSFALFNASALQSWIDMHRDLLHRVMILTQSGQVIAHTTPEYVGSIISEDPVVGEITSKANSSGLGTFSRAKNSSVVAAYEKLADSNLYVLIESNREVLLRPYVNSRLQLILIAAGILVMGTGIFILLNRQLVKVTPSAPTFAAQVKSEVPTLLTQQNTEQTSDRWALYAKVASAISHELKAPIAAILSSARLLRPVLGTNEELKKIEEEAQQGRQVLQKLLEFAGETESPRVATNVATIMESALRMFENQFRAKNIQVSAEIDEVPDLQLVPDLLLRVFEQILRNSIESMERMGTKKIAIQVAPAGENVRISIKDSGHGLSDEDQNRVFDPFFTTKTGKEHMGLGLAFVYGVIKQFDGVIAIQSLESDGTEIIIDFKKQLVEKQRVSEAQTFQVQSPPPVSVQSPAGGLPVPRAPKNIQTTQFPPPPTITQNPSRTMENRAVSQRTRHSEPMQLFKDGEIDRLLDFKDLSEIKEELRPESAIENLGVTSFSKELDFIETKMSFPKLPQIKFDKKAAKVDLTGVKIRKPGSGAEI